MLLPYNVDVPMERWPWANWLLIAVTVVVSIAAWVTSEPFQDVRDAIRLVQQDDPKQVHREAKELQRRLRQPPPPPLALVRGPLRPAELFSYMFGHTNIWHLIG